MIAVETREARSEQLELVGRHASELVVVDLDPAKSSRLGEHLRLRLDRLGDEHASNVTERGVELESLDVAGQLLDAVDLTAALDFHRNHLVDAVATHQVDRADCGGVLAPNEAKTCLDRLWRRR